MSAASVRAAVAAKVATLGLARHVYAAEAGAGVAPWPQELVDDGPHALVVRGASGRSGGTGNQVISRAVDVEWRFSGLDLAGAEATIDGLEDQLITAFSSGITLGGSVIDLVYQGSDRPADVEEDGRPWVLWITHLVARERVALEMSA